MKDLAALTMAIIALFPYGSACASTSAEIREARLARHIEEAILALRFNGDADSLAAAALLKSLRTSRPIITAHRPRKRRGRRLMPQPRGRLIVDSQSFQYSERMFLHARGASRRLFRRGEMQQITLLPSGGKRMKGFG
jgi:hypothetical protein